MPSEITSFDKFVIALATVEFLLCMFISYMDFEPSLVIRLVGAFITIVFLRMFISHMAFEPSVVIRLVAAFFTIVFLPMFISYMVSELSLVITFVAASFAIVLSSIGHNCSRCRFITRPLRLVWKTA